MQLMSNAAFVLVFCAAMVASMELSANGEVIRVKRLAIPKKLTDKLYNFDIELKKLVLGSISADYIGDLNYARIEMYNDSMPVINGIIDCVKDFPPNLMIQIVGYRFSETNQWVLSFDQGRQVYCDFVENNVTFMQNVLKASNFTECPVKKGLYKITNMVIDEKSFPPRLPEGKFRVDAIFTAEEQLVGRVLFYADVLQKDEDYD